MWTNVSIFWDMSSPLPTPTAVTFYTRKLSSVNMLFKSEIFRVLDLSRCGRASHVPRKSSDSAKQTQIG